MSALGTGLQIGSLIVGGIGALTSSTPSYDMSAFTKSWDLINQQSQNLDAYYKTAGESLESQFNTLYGNTMQTAVNTLASRGIYNSPVSQVSMNRTTQQLADTYANAKSQLAAQQMTAQNSIDQQKMSYYYNLANAQYQQQLADYNSNANTLATIGGAIGAIGGLL